MGKYNEVGNNNKHKGEQAQKFVIAAFARYEIEVALPMSDNLPFDFVAIYNGKLFKVQVKSSTKGNKGSDVETVVFSCRRSNWWRKTQTKYTAEDADVFVGYDARDGGVYLLKQSDFVGRNCFSIRKHPSRGVRKGCNFSDDYCINEERIKKVFGLEALTAKH